MFNYYFCSGWSTISEILRECKDIVEVNHMYDDELYMCTHSYPLVGPDELFFSAVYSVEVVTPISKVWIDVDGHYAYIAQTTAEFRRLKDIVPKWVSMAENLGRDGLEMIPNAVRWEE